MKKYMIRCDIEGVTGVVSYEQAEPGRPEYSFGQRMFMSDLLSLVKGLNAGGADEIIIYDEHYYGRNIDMDVLPTNTLAICGKPPYRSGWAGGLDGSFTGLILLGFHSKYGTPGGLLPHSYELDIKDLRLNGLSVGEIGMETAVAGDFSVPLVMMCGDSAGVKEAKILVPEAEFVEVKVSVSEHGGLCYPAEVTKKSIFSAARKTAENNTAVEPFVIKAPVVLEVELNEGPYLEAFKKFSGIQAKDQNIFIIKGVNATDVWSQYWYAKITAQKKMK
jgi:D-amino peptidase